jgi:hypothetical protein
MNTGIIFKAYFNTNNKLIQLTTQIPLPATRRGLHKFCAVSSEGLLL